MNRITSKELVGACMKRVCILTLSIVLSSATGAAAADMKPGLWELSGRFTSDSGRIEQMMANVEKSLKKLPPEQQKILKKSEIGLRKGVTSARICVSPELARDDPVVTINSPMETPECQLLSDDQKAATRTRVVLCESPLLELEQRWVTDPATGLLLETSSVHLMELEFDGVQEHLRVLSRWKFVSASCGNIRPLRARREQLSSR